MSDKALREIYHEAYRRRLDSYKDGYRVSFTLEEFDELIYLPLRNLVQEAHDHQLEEIRERGT
jgi:hypothetical protein